jgi:NADPH2:quinone reductase
VRSRTMRAVGLDEFGGPGVLHVVELPVPEPQAGEVRVRVAAATVNPTDVLFRSGRQLARMAGMTPPYIPGMEFAGAVDLPGPGVDLRPGSKLMGIMQPRSERGGAQAEFVVASAQSVVPIPGGIDFAHAATVPMNGLTALMAVQAANVLPGEPLLITGAAGAVGGYCVQLAKAGGMTVLADAKEQDELLVRNLGADYIYRRGPHLADAVRARWPAGVAGLIDAALMGPIVYAVVESNRRVVALRATGPDPAGRLQVSDVSVTEQASNTAALRKLADLTAQGVLTPRVAQCLPMGAASQAHELLAAGGVRGRLVLTF